MLFSSQETLPCAEYYKRQGFPLKKIVQFAAARDYTDVMVFNEDRKEVNGLLLVHLPDGPTAHFRLSNLKLGRDIKVSGSWNIGEEDVSAERVSTLLKGMGTCKRLTMQVYTCCISDSWCEYSRIDS